MGHGDRVFTSFEAAEFMVANKTEEECSPHMNERIECNDSVSCSTSETETNVEPAACPTPLGWKKVVSTFTEEATAWSIPFNGKTLTGKTWGTGPAIVIVGSLTNRLNLFSLLVYLLHEEFTCIVLEPSNAKSFTPQSLSDELLAVADYHQQETFHIYASGFGAVAALQTAISHPQRINKIILQGGFAQRTLSFAERLLLSVGRYCPGRLRSLPGFRSIFIQNHLRWFPPFDGSRWQFFDAEVGEHRIAHLARLATVLKSFDVRDQLHKISHEVLILRTEGDGTVLTAHQAELLSSLPNATEEYFQHSGTLTHLTHPHRVSKTVHPFLLDEQK